MTFELIRLRLEFLARDSLYFPPHKPGNILRGAFGHIFRSLACEPACADARSCARAAECSYARVFEPRPVGVHPSGLAELPRPFVFRATHLDGRTIAPGEPFHFDLHLFDLCQPLDRYFISAFERLATEGLGPGRGRAELRANSSARVAVRLDAVAPANGVRVRFVAPTELKTGSQLAPKPEFPILYARLRDRISTLRAAYGAGPLAIDFRAAAERASRVSMTRCDLEWERVERRSSRTGQTHPLGGFTGEAEYAGELGEFLPYLELGQWTGVGRQTVWGKGEIAVERLA
ncbi:MAG: CRISPR system precrRNA processing endoribonuclease RAMP protein Cas6 [Bryobacteraceae bacterium]